MAGRVVEPRKGESVPGWIRANAARIARELARLSRLLAVEGASGLEVVGGTLRVVPGPEPLKAKAPAGGIAAKSGNVPGSAAVTLYQWDGTSETLSSLTLTALNSYGAAVGANKDVWLVFARGEWWVLTESCS